MIPRLKRQTKTRHSGRVLGIAGAALVVSGRLYQIALHPEWTEAQTLRNLWPLWFAAVLLILVAIRVARLSPDVWTP